MIGKKKYTKKKLFDNHRVKTENGTKNIYKLHIYKCDWIFVKVNNRNKQATVKKFMKNKINVK